jgi:subtilisin family serine protease
MIPRIFIIIVAIFTFSFSFQAKAELSKPVSGQYIVKLKSGESVQALANKHGLEIEHQFSNIFNGASVKVPPGIEKKLEVDPSVEKLVQDFTVSAFNEGGIKGSMGGMGGTPSPPQIIPTGINWIDAELNTTNEGSGVTVAIVDTGIDTNHADLMVNTSLSKNFTRGKTSQFNDDNGHGTAVAGIVGALDNSIDVLGVGSQINLVSVKVLDSTGSGYFSWIIAGLDHITANANVIGVANLSLGAVGGTNPSQGFLDAAQLLREAVQRATNAGVVVVVAAGNESTNVTTSNVVPGGYPEVISVSALNDSDGVQGNDSWASFSNFGTEVDIIAPGVNIVSTARGGGVTNPISGTSFSSPHVAGTVGLYIAKNGRPANGNAQLLGSLISSISQSRSSLPGEPADGVTEPSCYANGAALK